MSRSDESNLCFAGIAELSGHVLRREISPVEIAEAIVNRIEEHNDKLKAYISVLQDTAFEQARQAEREIQQGRYRGPLHGIPISLKDNIATQGIRTSCASMVNPEWIPDHDATVYTRLRESGAILVGKANLYEYAFGMNPAFPQPPNPWNADRTTSGSSSGSAVGVATGMAYASIGSDTGGSGRVPASFTGVVGLKPTYGRVSRAGLFPYSYSLDHVTVLTRLVADASIVMEAVAGYDPRDQYSSSEPVPAMRAEITGGIRGMRIGLAHGYTFEDIDQDVVSVIGRAVGVLQDLGSDIEYVELPYVEHCVAVRESITLPEAAVVHFRSLRETPEGLGEPAVTRLDLGSVIPATAYIRAQQIRNLMRNEFRRIFDRFDAIVGPASPVRAGEVGTWTVQAGATEVDLRDLASEYTGIYNLVGNPAIVIPAGFSSEGTPIGLQIAGRWFDETTVLRIAHAFEEATDWHQCRPPMPAA